MNESLRRAAGVLLLLFLPLSGRFPAAGDVPPTPEAAALRGHEALQKGRLEEFAGAMHPDALRRFRTLLESIVDAAAREKREKEVLGLFRAESMEALRGMTDAGFFTAYLRGTLDEDTRAYLAATRARSLGHVAEGADIRHVVMRTHYAADGANLTRMVPVSVRRSPGGWLMQLSGDMEGVAAALKRRFEAAGGDPAGGVPDVRPRGVEVLGHVLEGKEQAHVVYRVTVGAGPVAVTRLGVMTFPKSDREAWSLVQRGDRAGLARVIRRKAF